ncbi:MAG: 2-phospho-L-lactate transferase [Dehalococcoidia bacterium]
MITVIAGGVGAAKFLRGLVDVVEAASITVIGNTGDDETFLGLHVSPDLDTVVYTLSDAVDPEQGWGQADETYACLEQAARLGEETWFRLGDADLATHVQRTQLLREGRSLSEATESIARAFGVACRLLPVSDQPVRTVVTTEAGELSFQEYFVRRRQQDEVRALRFEGVESARPAPGVLEAIAEAETVVIAPSNPLVSIGPVLAVPGVREALVETKAPVVAVSPIVGGRALKGPADRMMTSLGYESSALGVARLYADFLDALVLDEQDASLASEVESLGVRAVVTDTIMRDPASRRALAEATLAAARAPEAGL